MKIEDATKVKEKLDDILLAVDEYGKQSEQFSKARQNLFDLLGVMNNTNDSLGKLLSDCDQYLKKASEVIDGEYFVKIQAVIEDIKGTASDLEKCNDDTSKASIKLIEESKNQLSDLADNLSKNIQSSIDKVNMTANDLQNYSAKASEKAQELIESSNNHVLQMIDNLNNACNRLIDSNDQLHKSYDNVMDNINIAAKQLVETIKNEIEKTNKQIDKIIEKLSDIEAEEKSIIQKEEEIKEIISDCFNTLKKSIEEGNNQNALSFSSLENTIKAEFDESKQLQSTTDNNLGQLYDLTKKTIIGGAISLGIMLILIIVGWFIA